MNEATKQYNTTQQKQKRATTKTNHNKKQNATWNNTKQEHRNTENPTNTSQATDAESQW